VLDEEMIGACERVMRGLCAEMGAELREFNGEHDHVRLLVQYPPKLAISTLTNRLKAVSAHYLRAEYASRINQHLVHGHLWSPSYFAVSAGDAPLAVTRQYTDNHNRPDQNRSDSLGPERPESPATYCW
jgi:putative transposase